MGFGGLSASFVIGRKSKIRKSKWVRPFIRKAKKSSLILLTFQCKKYRLNVIYRLHLIRFNWLAPQESGSEIWPTSFTQQSVVYSLGGVFLAEAECTAAKAFGNKAADVNETKHANSLWKPWKLTPKHRLRWTPKMRHVISLNLKKSVQNRKLLSCYTSTAIQSSGEISKWLIGSIAIFSQGK